MDVCIKCGKRAAEIGLLCRSCFVPKIKMPKPITIIKCRDCGKLYIQGKWQHMTTKKLSNYLAKKIKGDFERAELDIENKEAHIYYNTDNGEEVEYTFPFPLKFEKGLCPQCSRAHGGYYEAIFQLRGDPKKIRRMKNMFLRYAHDKTFINKEEEKHGGIDIYVGHSKVLIQFLAENRIKDYKLSRKLHTQKEGKRQYRITIALRL